MIITFTNICSKHNGSHNTWFVFSLHLFVVHVLEKVCYQSASSEDFNIVKAIYFSVYNNCDVSLHKKWWSDTV